MVEFWSRNCLAVFFLIWEFHEFSQCSKPWLLDDYRGLHYPIGESIWTNQYNWQYHHQTSHPPGSPLGFPWGPRAWDVRSLSGGCGLERMWFGWWVGLVWKSFTGNLVFFSQEIWGFPVDVPEKKTIQWDLEDFANQKKLHATETTSDLKLTDHHGDYIAPPKSKTPVNYIPQLHLYRSICLFYLSILSIYLSINQSINLSICLSLSI